MRHSGAAIGFNARVGDLCVHSRYATATITALQHNANINRVQKWPGHARIATTHLYDRRGARPEEGPTFRGKYLSARPVTRECPHAPARGKVHHRAAGMELRTCCQSAEQDMGEPRFRR